MYIVQQPFVKEFDRRIEFCETMRIIESYESQAYASWRAEAWQNVQILFSNWTEADEFEMSSEKDTLIVAGAFSYEWRVFAAKSQKEKALVDYVIGQKSKQVYNFVFLLH